MHQKKKTAKKTSSKKKKVIRKIDSTRKVPMSVFICSALLQAVSDEIIIEEMKEYYPPHLCTQKTVAYFRYNINQGKMEKLGFSRPKNGLKITAKRVK